MSRDRISVIAAIAAAGLAGCGGGGGEGTQPTTTAAKTTSAKPAPAAGTQNVSMDATEFKFNPSKVNVKAGRITFKVANSGAAPHALEVEGNSVEEETETIQPGGSGQLRINLAPGTYKMYCPVGDHEQRGMVGELTVR
jgi:uncharacterized cupredoxin-like copper-binding protein